MAEGSVSGQRCSKTFNNRLPRAYIGINEKHLFSAGDLVGILWCQLLHTQSSHIRKITQEFENSMRHGVVTPQRVADCDQDRVHWGGRSSTPPASTSRAVFGR